MPQQASAPQSGTVAMTLGGHADRGLTLAALYDTGVLAKLRLDVRVRLLADVTQSLAWLHANPRLMSAHRHLLIAPSTIVIGLDGVARVDVRAAKKPTSERGELEADYLAPEVRSGDAGADHRADIFSIGVLSWEALAGQRIGEALTAPALDRGVLRADAGEDETGEVPVALGPGRATREPARRKPAARALTTTQDRPRAIPPPLTLSEDAEWAMPFAQMALSAMSVDVSRRPQDCRALIEQLELIDPLCLANNQEIADVVQGLSAVATLCVPEPILPATDAVCQADRSALQFMDREPCSSLDLERCLQPQLPPQKRVPAPSTGVAARSSMPPRAPSAAPRASGAGKLGAGPSTRVWFAAALLCLALLGSLAGYIASLLSR